MTDAFTKSRLPKFLGGRDAEAILGSQSMINPPRISHHHSNRLRECQRSVVTDLNALIDAATAIGWDRQEVIAGLADLLDTEPSDADSLLRAMAGYVGQPTRHVA
ncbi:hypothetical protein FP026_25065 [Rhizobium tropici]|uniref:Uncharacterized protein n=1 Tax=Rhizobium tropici TaxID=398 RepID=A0A5B0VSS3_RHITR|nr:hypothetical protein [Rhizobium tropici]KAA1177175.1 hypothetical protein FP026_25065 [Rhizobium tropici]